MDLYEKQDLQEFLVFLFGKQAKNWPMNEGIFNLTYELVEESSSCSSAMDYVPRPVPYGTNPFKWLTKQAREAFVRELKDNKEQYVVCLRAAAVRMVRRFQMESMGV
ncbi:hypothetical protein A9Q99_19655 [Gammaproteobacteria bacterium 45_16_T64]|nr:hypothetical protein A9Q99_19655 [Gammaproteobacteria bacterium 45_16_T64]